MLKMLFCIVAIQGKLIQFFEKIVDIVLMTLVDPFDSFFKRLFIEAMAVAFELGHYKLFFLTIHGAN